MVTTYTHRNQSDSNNSKSQLADKVKRIKDSCGEVCDTQKTGVKQNPDAVFPYIHKKIDCKTIFDNAEIHDESDKQVIIN